jgi:hypothetical protein
VDRLLMGFNFGNQRVDIADLEFVVCEKRKAPASEAALPVRPVDPAGRRIAILRESSVEKQPGHADPERLAKLLREAGFSPVFLRAAELCEKTGLMGQIDFG